MTFRRLPRPALLVLSTLSVFSGCDTPRTRLDVDLPEPPDAGAAGANAGHDGGHDVGATADAAGRDGSPVTDAAARDAAFPPDLDAAVPFTDGRVPVGDADLPPDLGGFPPNDGFLADAAQPRPDGAVPPPLDGAIPPPDLALPGADAAAPPADAAQLDPDAAAPLESALHGTARAADGRTTVHVTETNTGVQADATPPGFTFTLSPVPLGRPLHLTFEAAHHATEAVDFRFPAAPPVADADLPDEVYLYRGVRVNDAPAADRLFFAPGAPFLLWTSPGTLTAQALNTLDTPPALLVAAEYEVFLGLTPDHTAAVIRRNNRPGLAGDVDLRPLVGGAPLPLFEQAQPWVTWFDNRALAMTHTQGGLSVLQARTLGAAGAAVVAGNVPWLSVTTLRDGAVVYASSAGLMYDLFTTDPVHLDLQTQLTGPANRTDGAWLHGLRSGQGVMWHTADGQVWRYHQLENGPFRVAAGVIASPPPVARYDDDRVYVFHGDDPADVQVGELSGDGVETLRPERGDARTFRTLPGGGFALVTPGVGLTVVPGLGGVVASVPGRVISVAQAGTDLFVLADGAAFVVGADGVPQPRGDGPFTDLQPAPTGATVLQTAGGQATLYWLHPSANPAGEDTAPVRLAQGPAPLSRLSDYAGHGLWARGAAGWGRTLLPPAAPAVNVDREVTRLLTLDADRTLATTPDGHIVQIDARSGATFEWARNATLLENTGRDFAAYEADRGIFVVPLPDAPNP